MRKWIFCTAIVAAVPILAFGGFGGEDVGKLQPVQVVSIAKQENRVILLTDTGDRGAGADVSRAIKDMKATSAARVFLDTADYLLVEPDAEAWLPQLQSHLRPSCNVCFVEGTVDLELAGQYLQLHQPKFTMMQYEAGERRLPCLRTEEGRMKLVRP